MLSPKIHGLDQFRLLNRFTARHDWRRPETGLVFKAGSGTFQVMAIQPKDESQKRHWAFAVVRDLANGRVFTETLASLWSQWDNCSGFAFTQGYIQKAIARNRKVAKRQAAIRRYLVQEGLVVA